MRYFDKSFLKKKCSFDQPFLFFWINKKCFLRLYLELKPFRGQKGFLSLFETMFSFLFFTFFTISLASFLNTSFVCPFFPPFLSLSLLVSLSWFVSSSWFFLSSFFHMLFDHFSLCSLCFVFLFLFGAHFSCSLSFLLVAIVVWAFFVAFRISCFFGLFNFFEKKKLVLKSLILFCESFFLFFNKKLSVFLNFSFIVLSLLHNKNVFLKKMLPFVTVFLTKTLFLVCWSF